MSAVKPKVEVLRQRMPGIHGCLGPIVGEKLRLEREPENTEDQQAVAIKTDDGQIVGHCQASWQQ